MGFVSPLTFLILAILVTAVHGQGLRGFYNYPPFLRHVSENEPPWSDEGVNYDEEQPLVVYRNSRSDPPPHEDEEQSDSSQYHEDEDNNWEYVHPGGARADLEGEGIDLNAPNQVVFTDYNMRPLAVARADYDDDEDDDYNDDDDHHHNKYAHMHKDYGKKHGSHLHGQWGYNTYQYPLNVFHHGGKYVHPLDKYDNYGKHGWGWPSLYHVARKKYNNKLSGHYVHPVHKLHSLLQHKLVHQKKSVQLEIKL